MSSCRNFYSAIVSVLLVVLGHGAFAASQADKKSAEIFQKTERFLTSYDCAPSKFVGGSDLLKMFSVSDVENQLGERMVRAVEKLKPRDKALLSTVDLAILQKSAYGNNNNFAGVKKTLVGLVDKVVWLLDKSPLVVSFGGQQFQLPMEVVQLKGGAPTGLLKVQVQGPLPSLVAYGGGDLNVTYKKHLYSIMLKHSYVESPLLKRVLVDDGVRLGMGKRVDTLFTRFVAQKFEAPLFLAQCKKRGK